MLLLLVAAMGSHCSTQTSSEGFLVFSEIMPKHDAQTFSWVEIYNTQGFSISLDGLSLQLGEASAVIIAKKGLMLGPGEYFVIAERGADLPHVGWEMDAWVPAKNGHLSMSLGSAFMDQVHYKNKHGWIVRKGRSLALDPAALRSTDNDHGVSWCSMKSKGTPGTPNPICESCTGGSRVGEGGSDWIFDPHAIPTIDVEIAPEDVAYLREHPFDKTYVPARVVVGGIAHNAGVTYKGHSTLFNCFDENGQQTCDKLSLRIRFDAFDTCGRFFGLRRIILQSYTYDSSIIHERISYGIFAQMGIAVPRASHAELVVNGTHKGIYGLIEAVDKEFIERHFDGEGILYKEVWPVFSNSLHYK